MPNRIRLSHLAAAALAISHRRSSVCARSTALSLSERQPAIRQQQHAATSNSTTTTCGRSCSVGPLQSQQLQLKASSAAPIPWLTVAGLRGGCEAGAIVHTSRLKGGEATTPVHRSLTICGLFGISYLFSVLFNVNNKRALLLVPIPWTFAALNLSIGSVIALASWSFKIAPCPRLTWQDIGALIPIGLLHAVSHLTVVLGLGAGAVSFLHTVKASEACFTALLSFLFLGQTLPLPVYLTLVPVVIGVALTCCGQGLRFSWLALMSALVSNLSNALRNVLIVKNMGPTAASRRKDGKPGISPPRFSTSFLRPGAAAGGDASATDLVARKIKSAVKYPVAALASTRAGGATRRDQGVRSGLDNLAPGDTFRLLTVIGAAMLIPAAAYFEHGSWPKLWRGATDAAGALVGRTSGSPLGEALGSRAGVSAAAAAASVGKAAVEAAVREKWAEAFWRALLSGVCFNLFYDLTFRLLGQLHPVTHAVGNTIKRIVVIGAGAFAFGGDLGGARGICGSSLAVLGVLGYSVAKARCKPTMGHGGRNTD